MNMASLAFASALAAVVGCAQPALAQSQDQTGATTNQNGSSMNGPAASPGPGMNGANRSGDETTGGANPGSDNGAMDNDEDNDRAADRDGDWHRQRDGHRPMGEMGMMWRHRMMMRAAGGARFHFARGNARIDVRCPADEDVRVCVRAAGELLDKIAELHNGGRGGNTTGSGSGLENDETGGAGASPNGQPSEQNPPAQQNQNGSGIPGQRM
jgi:hypothetical protein